MPAEPTVILASLGFIVLAATLNFGFFIGDISLAVAFLLAIFAVLFGTRHADATEHQDGLILAIAMESVVKLVAFWTLGVFVIWTMFDGPADLWQKATESEAVMAALSHETPASRWILLIALSAFAIIMLPRQFHVTVVENRTPRELKLAGILMPIYLIAINIFVLPAAIAGILIFGGSGDADLYVLSLPLEAGSGFVSLLTFIGGFSAATAMVIVASVALAIALRAADSSMAPSCTSACSCMLRSAMAARAGAASVGRRQTCSLSSRVSLFSMPFHHTSAAELKG